MLKSALIHEVYNLVPATSRGFNECGQHVIHHHLDSGQTVYATLERMSTSKLRLLAGQLTSACAID